jgi:2-polyprenyl-6-hydroxyphenyl methylase/3-demethylubiquinone-9 3-methyltransferase
MRGLIRRLHPASPDGPALKILDVGCAQGNLALMLAEDGHDVVAADLRPEFLHYVRRKYERGRLALVALNAEHLPFKPVFDLVVLGELLEHAAHPDQLLTAAGNVLRPGGAVLVTTPNGRFLLNRLPVYEEARTRAELESHQFAPDADGHLFLLTSKELTGLAEEAGLQTHLLRYFNSPFATGLVKWRHVGRLMPPTVSRMLEKLVSSLPWVRTRLCSGLALLAFRRADPTDHNGSR